MMDINGDGKVDYEEFITASMNRDKMINDKNIKMLFEMFDTDGSGYIDAAELKNVFSKCIASGNDVEDEKIFEDLMLEVDKNGDKVISHEEFNQVMNEILKKKADNGSQMHI